MRGRGCKLGRAGEASAQQLRCGYYRVNSICSILFERRLITDERSRDIVMVTRGPPAPAARPLPYSTRSPKTITQFRRNRFDCVQITLLALRASRRQTLHAPQKVGNNSSIESSLTVNTFVYLHRSNAPRRWVSSGIKRRRCAAPARHYGPSDRQYKAYNVDIQLAGYAEAITASLDKLLKRAADQERLIESSPSEFRTAAGEHSEPAAGSARRLRLKRGFRFMGGSGADGAAGRRMSRKKLLLPKRARTMALRDIVSRETAAPGARAAAARLVPAVLEHAH
ncbi:hypothetical protein EVAR_48405_1 [Eumeta japonica]|uniref:Uncharacterized protein n=1 Tax=Eumeta variegata TaxID=151549 RepID=A0A4C1XT45_EUMVA|nr:hypothetical protein EVAR_48405_1 [Eumeta japonica]